MLFSCTQVAETRCKKVCTSKSDLRTNDFSIVGSLPRDFELSNFDCYGKPIDIGSAHGKSQAKNNKKPPPPKPVIPSAAKRVDLYARALFPFSFLFFNVVYWSVYLWLFRNGLVSSTSPTSPQWVLNWLHSKSSIPKSVSAFTCTLVSWFWVLSCFQMQDVTFKPNMKNLVIHIPVYMIITVSRVLCPDFSSSHPLFFCTNKDSESRSGVYVPKYPGFYCSSPASRSRFLKPGTMFTTRT